jgi:hypothetical protein
VIPPDASAAFVANKKRRAGGLSEAARSAASARVPFEIDGLEGTEGALGPARDLVGLNRLRGIHLGSRHAGADDIDAVERASAAIWSSRRRQAK